ncbi:MAG: dienelactone hydrolase family protein [Anaerolineae bacterium]
MQTPSTDNDLAGLTYRLRRGPASGLLLIMLHGLGGDEHVMGIFDRSVPEPFTVISPRAPIVIEPRMFPGYTDRGYSWLRSDFPVDRSSLDTALDQLRRFVLAALDEYELDREQVFLMGFSQGAAISYALSLAEPNLIAGVIALAGFMPDVAHPATTPTHGYLIIHGTDDQTVPLLRAHQARDFLRALGAPVEYHAYPVGHKVAPQGLRDIQMWLRKALEIRNQNSE